jgi:hypothetical protein
MAEPYIPQSRLLAQYLAQQRQVAPVYSMGQGLAQLSGELGKAYALRTMEDRDIAKREDYAAQLGKAIGLAGDRGMNELRAQTQAGNAPQSQPMLPNGPAPVDINQKFTPAQTQPMFDPEMTKPMNYQDRAFAAMKMIDPKVASQNMAEIIAASKFAEPEKDKYGFGAGVGVYREPANGGVPEVVLPVAPPRDPSAPLSPERFAQEKDLRRASQAPQKAKGAGELYKDKFGGDVESGMRPELDANGVPTGKQVPIEGGAKDPKVIEEKRQTDLRNILPKTRSALDASLKDIDATLDVIQRIRDNPTGLGDVTGFGGTGIGKFLTLSGGDAAKAQSDIDQLTGKRFLAGMSALKAQSPTGSTGLGAASEREGQNVISASAALNQEQGDKDYLSRLDDYEKSLKGAKSNLESVFRSEFGPVLPKVKVFNPKTGKIEEQTL